MSIVRFLRRAHRFGVNLSGLVPEFVGLNVGKSGLPDKDQRRGINSVAGVCRECRIYPTRKSDGEFWTEQCARRHREASRHGN